MPRILCFALALSLCATTGLAETVRIPASADVWLSHATPRESNSGAGGSVVFKLKSVQELAALRFELEPWQGRQILSARLHLRTRGELAPPSWLRVSTVTSRWTEGEATRAYSGRDGATWNHADASRRHAWSWPGSEFSDVCMGAGQSLVEVAKLISDEDGWCHAEISKELLQAILSGASDGLALMEGGSPHDRNHYFHSAQSWESAPWLELELGPKLAEAPPAPMLRVQAAPDAATLESCAVLVQVRADSTDFAWNAWLNGERLDPWQLPRVGSRGNLEWTLTGLPPASEQALDLCAVSSTGVRSPKTTVSFVTPGSLPEASPLEAASSSSPILRRAQAPTLWALPALTRIDPIRGSLLSPDPQDGGESPWNLNPVWNGAEVDLLGARAETITFTLVAAADVCPPPARVRVTPPRLRTRGHPPLDSKRWSLRETWYRPRPKRWEGSYLRPVPSDDWIDRPSAEGLPDEARWRTFRVELKIPADAAPGIYRGEFVVEFECGRARLLPVRLELSPWRMPREPSFRIELNAYQFPEEAVAHFRLARENRAVFTPWVLTPDLEGVPPELEVDWESYDASLASLLDGSAFGEEDPRPLEVLYLPFWESWPVELSPRHYAFPEPWPSKGDPFQLMWDHHLTAPPIQDAFSVEYLESLRRVQRQFVDHFAENEWRDTELHCFYGSKMSHFTRYGRKSFWNTDEPLYLADWQALEFFTRYFSLGLESSERARWRSRADVSRPEWLEGALGDAAKIVYTGGQLSSARARRLREMAERLDFRWMVYRAASTDEVEPTHSAVWILESFLDGAKGALVWLSLGDRNSWRDGDPAEFPGTALMAKFPESRVPVGDLRLLALREAQQLSEWITVVGRQEGLTREQLDGVLEAVFRTQDSGWWRGQENEIRPNRRGGLHANDIERLRRMLAKRWRSGHELK